MAVVVVKRRRLREERIHVAVPGGYPSATSLALQHHFRKINDSRLHRHKRHQLLDLIVIA